MAQSIKDMTSSWRDVMLSRVEAKSSRVDQRDSLSRSVALRRVSKSLAWVLKNSIRSSSRATSSPTASMSLTASSTLARRSLTSVVKSATCVARFSVASSEFRHSRAAFLSEATSSRDLSLSFSLSLKDRKKECFDGETMAERADSLKNSLP